MPVDNDLSAVEREKFLRVVQDSLVVDRHFQLFLWLQGEFQHFLPHEIFIAMVGDFASGDIAVDIVSGLPGVRTVHCLPCGVRQVGIELYARWRYNGYQMLSLGDELGHLLTGERCRCPMLPMLAGKGSMLAHGLRDSRSGEDALYLLMSPAVALGERQMHAFGMLLPMIDFACRRIVALKDDSVVRSGRLGQNVELSPRELEILDWVRMGKTNEDIGMILNISAFTVKNHLQRVYRKMDVLNRAQAVAKLNDLNRWRQPAGH